MGRLAPSATGAQHLGNASTYLLAWLSVRSRNGKVILRIEDIDSPRIKPWAIQQAMDDLCWLGLDWDEGPDIGGPAKSYIQTQRKLHHEEALASLVNAADRVFPCTCSRKDIEEALSAPHESLDGPVYPGTCAAWDGSTQPKPNSCWRFRLEESEMKFNDLVQGQCELNPRKCLGDFPITRKTGDVAYQLAVVLDDIAMGVTEVLRGEDLVPSTFRQLSLYTYLDEPAPQHAHVPLIIGDDGRRLAKRHGDTRLSQFRGAGTQPEAIVGWAAWKAGLIDKWDRISARELLDDFDLSKLVKDSPIVTSDTKRQLLSMT